MSFEKQERAESCVEVRVPMTLRISALNGHNSPDSRIGIVRLDTLFNCQVLQVDALNFKLTLGQLCLNTAPCKLLLQSPSPSWGAAVDSQASPTRRLSYALSYTILGTFVRQSPQSDSAVTDSTMPMAPITVIATCNMPTSSVEMSPTSTAASMLASSVSGVRVSLRPDFYKNKAKYRQ